MIIRLLVAGIALGLAGAAHAACAGNGTTQICTDQFGNVFIVDQAGNITPVKQPEPERPSPDQSILLASVSHPYERDQRRSWNEPFATWENLSFNEESFGAWPSYSTPSYEGGSPQ